MSLAKRIQFLFFLSVAKFICSGRIRNPNIRNELQLFPFLFNISFIKETTQNYDHFRVFLKETDQKGLGVFSSRRIPANRTVMYYRLKIFENTYQRVGDGKYSLVVMKRFNNAYVIDDNKVADLYEGSNSQPIARIPFWAYIANEPDVTESPNCVLVLVTIKDWFNVGELLLLKLASIKDIEPGQEITW
ncbi:hypothetical protein BpHYR1_037433 [Brachionus plicatilis]|uniref:SET domain-containing protein n=1 Tax=Brachionus plicatilis TaxID=10195 RepID=A0A3M7RTC4_BRAPC|nr:hypothetical protein BpHYR1_037433 [Brachionus plicatilis]